MMKIKTGNSGGVQLLDARMKAWVGVIDYWVLRETTEPTPRRLPRVYIPGLADLGGEIRGRLHVKRTGSKFFLATGDVTLGNKPYQVGMFGPAYLEVRMLDSIRFSATFMAAGPWREVLRMKLPSRSAKTRKTRIRPNLH